MVLWQSASAEFVVRSKLDAHWGDYNMTSTMFSHFHKLKANWFQFTQHALTIGNDIVALRWHHNDHAGVSNYQPHGCLLNRLFRRKSKKTSKLRVTGLCAGNSPGTGEFPAQMASYAKNVSIWWRHHGACLPLITMWPVIKYHGVCDILSPITHGIIHHQWPLLLTWFNFNPSMDK